jgi:hypothetical protein
MRARSTLMALLVSFALAIPAYGYEFDEDEVTESSSWTEIIEHKKGASCMDSCLADGEELFDCEYYCIQTAERSLSSKGACSRR